MSPARPEAVAVGGAREKQERLPLGRRTECHAACCPVPAPAARGFAFRANVSRELTHPICRLPLDYLVLLARAFKAWGPDADMGTARHVGDVTPLSFS